MGTTSHPLAAKTDGWFVDAVDASTIFKHRPRGGRRADLYLLGKFGQAVIVQLAEEIERLAGGAASYHGVGAPGERADDSLEGWGGGFTRSALWVSDRSVVRWCGGRLHELLLRALVGGPSCV